MKFLARGKRAEVYSTTLYGKKVAVKIPRRDCKAYGFLEREFSVLKELNKHKLGPRVIKLTDGALFMEFIDGERIGDFLKTASRGQILWLLSKVLAQLRRLDTLGWNKQELSNPYKHILVTKNGVKLIDFERCRKSGKPSNITQFISYITSNKINTLLAQRGVFIRGERLRLLCKIYKRSPTHQNYKRILGEVLQRQFTHRVYHFVWRIPEGKVASYKQVAEAAGSRAYRAVGMLMHKNPFAPVVPCHRVVRDDGELGGFSRGLQEKIKMLKSEGVQITNGKIPARFFI